MLSFFKRKKKKSSGLPVPDWAPFKKSFQYEQFIEEVEMYFKRKQIDINISDGVVYQLNGDSMQLGLQNLAQVCAASAPKEYFMIVEKHFRPMIKMQSEKDPRDELAKTFDNVRGDIGVRIYNSENFQSAELKNMTYTTPLADGLTGVLVYDLPETVETIGESHFKHWNLPLEEVFEIGKLNTRNNYDLSPEEIQMQGIKAWLLTGHHFFAANLMYDIERYEGLVGTYGSLVAAPVRNATFVYPIESVEVIMAIHTLIPVILGMHKDGPGSLVDRLYWYQEGEYTDLPFEIKEEKLTFSPPAEFVHVLQGLPQ